MICIPQPPRAGIAARIAMRTALLPLLLATAPLTAQDHPLPLRALEKRGITVVGTFPSPGGLSAWAAYTGDHAIALYITPDGKNVIAGTMLDADGNVHELTPEMVRAAPKREQGGAVTSYSDRPRRACENSHELMCRESLSLATRRRAPGAS